MLIRNPLKILDPEQNYCQGNQDIHFSTKTYFKVNIIPISSFTRFNIKRFGKYNIKESNFANNSAVDQDLNVSEVFCHPDRKFSAKPYPDPS
jgi:hypothetical protein